MRRYLLSLLFIPILFSCEKELDFKYHEVESQLVIEGILSEDRAEVALSYTIPMDQPLPAMPVEEADVVLVDLTDNVSVSLHPENGIFLNPTGGIPGHIYELRVTHDGKNFTSSCGMRGAVEILDLKFQWIKMPYDHVAVLEIQSTVLDMEGTAYWTRIYRNGKPYKWLTSHGSGAIDGVLSQTTFTTRQNLEEEDDKDMLKDGDLVKVEVLPISLEMYDYLTAIQNDSNGAWMFKGDYCLGYFLAAGIAVDSIIFRPDEIPQY